MTTIITTNAPQPSITLTTEDGKVTVVQAPAAPSVVSAITEGPRGAKGEQGIAGLNFNVDTASVTTGSVVYYDGAASTFKADSTWTTSTLTDGGNF
jgi:hypothetical protein